MSNERHGDIKRHLPFSYGLYIRHRRALNVKKWLPDDYSRYYRNVLGKKKEHFIYSWNPA